MSVVSELLAEQAVQDGDKGAIPIARVMHACGWPWAPYVLFGVGGGAGQGRWPGGPARARGLAAADGVGGERAGAAEPIPTRRPRRG